MEKKDEEGSTYMLGVVGDEAKVHRPRLSIKRSLAPRELSLLNLSSFVACCTKDQAVNDNIAFCYENMCFDITAYNSTTTDKFIKSTKGIATMS